jgi:hypothetical protein
MSVLSIGGGGQAGAAMTGAAVLRLGCRPFGAGRAMAHFILQDGVDTLGRQAMLQAELLDRCSRFERIEYSTGHPGENLAVSRGKYFVDFFCFFVGHRPPLRNISRPDSRAKCGQI